MSVQEKLQRAVKLHQTGERQKARELYGEILQVDAENVDAIHLTGVLNLQEGQNEQALEFLERAIKLSPRAVNVLTNLGAVQRRLGKIDDAIETYKKALANDPNHAESYHNLGVALKAAAGFDEAIKCFRKALELKPGYSEAIKSLAQLEIQSGDWAKAIVTSEQVAKENPKDATAQLRLAECRMRLRQYQDAIKNFDAVLAVEPDHITALNGKGLAQKSLKSYQEAAKTLKRVLEIEEKNFPAMCNLGTVFQGLKQYDDAIQLYRRAIEIRPDSAEAHNNLGGALKEKGELEAAMDACRRALELKPTLASAHCNLAASHQLKGQFDEAIDLYKKALDLNGDMHEALMGLGSVFAQMGTLAQARKWYSRALFFKPDHQEARLYRGIIGLLDGDYETAFSDYEARLELIEAKKRIFKVPRWNGDRLENETLLLHSEQGLGDTIQFIRYAKYAKDLGAKVVVECQRPLLPLLARVDFVDQLVAQGDKLPPFSKYCPMLSLPGLFYPKLDSFPCDVPYLTPDPHLVQKWRDKIEALGPNRVGLAWQGNPDFKQDKFRSIPLTQFQGIIDADCLTPVSLQKGFGSEQIDNLDCKDKLVQLGEIDADEGAFMDTAAILQHLDLLVTSDSAIAHLAGALGIETWLILPFAPDWRWRLETESSDWYPSMKLYRQHAFNDWDGIMAEVLSDLQARFQGAAVNRDQQQEQPQPVSES